MSAPTTVGSWHRFDAIAAVLGAVLLAYFALPLATLLFVQSPVAAVASLGDPLVVRTAGHTLLTATASTALATLLGVPLAYWLARTDARGTSAVTAVVVFPLVLPPVVSGMLLLSAFGTPGLGGLTGLSLSRTLAGVVLAQTFVAAPFVVLTARSGFERVDRTLVDTARTLGASDWRVFRRVMAPLAGRAILAGVTLAFARAAGEFGATLMLAYHPRTLPVQIWVSFQSRGLDAAFPVALVLVALSVGAIAALRALGGPILWRET